MNRTLTHAVLIALFAVSLAACNHHRRTAQAALEVAISQAPPANLTVNSPAQITATVTNDSANGGVTWSCAPAGSCGTFEPATTASGTPTTYTAPAAPAAVTITATSKTDSSKTDTAHVNVTSGISVSLSTPPPANLAVNAQAPVTATVSGDQANGGVDWSCTPAGSCGSFNPAHTASGAATQYTAPGAAGPVTIKATSTTDNTQSASANVTITALAQNFAGSYVFYAAGTSVDDDDNYAIVGQVVIDDNGHVTSGVQDFNNGFNLTSAEPGGDSITGGTLAVDSSTGAGTLTLITNNVHMGDNGTETLAVVFVNHKHALIAQFDEAATSLGSMDIQTLSGSPNGGFAFTAAGLDVSDDAVIVGGIFSISGTSITNGVIDTNNDGEITLNQAFAGDISPADASGRGTISNTPFGVLVKYYIVGPEVIRIIDVDTTDFGFGTAYGQGEASGHFSNASLGKSVASISGAALFESQCIVGVISPAAPAAALVPGGVAHPNGQIVSNTFTAVVDVEDENVLFNALGISGSYHILANGYGGLSISGTPAFDTAYGLYAVDPNLNINDPNNTATGLGGVLTIDLTDFERQTFGFLVPQTDTATTSFAGDYAFGAQMASDLDEADLVGQGSVTGTSLSGIGAVNDPFEVFFGDSPLSGNIPFSGTVVADSDNPGRYFIHFLNLDIGNQSPIPFDAFIYQADGGQLFWLALTTKTDSDTFFTGVIQQQSLAQTTAAPASATKPKSRP